MISVNYYWGRYWRFLLAGRQAIAGAKADSAAVGDLRHRAGRIDIGVGGNIARGVWRRQIGHCEFIRNTDMSAHRIVLSTIYSG